MQHNPTVLTKSTCLFGPPTKGCNESTSGPHVELQPSIQRAWFALPANRVIVRCVPQHTQPQACPYDPPTHTRPSFCSRFYPDSVPKACASYRTDDHRITESQNVRGWKGPLWVIWANPSAEAGSPTAGCTGPCPGGS